MDQNEGIKIHSCRIIPALPVGRKTSGLSAKQGTPRNNDEHIYAFPMREGYSAEFVSAPERFCAPSVRVLLDTARVYVGIGPAVFPFRPTGQFLFFHLLFNFCVLFFELRCNFFVFFVLICRTMLEATGQLILLMAH